MWLSREFLIRVDVEQLPRQHPDGNLSLLFRFRCFKSAFLQFGAEGLKAGVGVLLGAANG